MLVENREPVQVKLVGENGNMFNLMGLFQRAAKNEGWTKEEIDTVLNAVMASEYPMSLKILLDHSKDQSEYEEEECDHLEDDG